MKKVLLIMAAALMTMTQCRKQATVPAAPATDTVKMTITAGPGAKTGIDDEGNIKWSEDDKLYVSDGSKWLGSLTLVGKDGSAQGTFTGSISEISDGTTCHFFYLGHDNGMTAPTANTGTAAVSISFASQDGSKDGENGAFKYHLGYGEAEVTVMDGKATGAVTMKTEIAIAHIKITMDSQPYTKSVTMTGVKNTMTVKPDGIFSGDGDGGITIGGSESGERYVTLIPTGTTSVDVSFNGTEGSLTFGQGIQANNLYGMANAIEVTLTPAHDYVNLGLPSKTLWATYNLGAEHEYDYGDYYAWGETAPYYKDEAWCEHPSHNENITFDANHGYGWKNYLNGSLTSWDESLDWKPYGTGTTLTSGYDAARAVWGGAWRMPTSAEWKELYDNTTPTWYPEGESNTEFNGVAGCKFTGKNEGYTDRYIFLPAAGCRTGPIFQWAGSYGYYCSSSLNTDKPDCAYGMYFHSSYVDSQYYFIRCVGFPVRPVR